MTRSGFGCERLGCERDAVGEARQSDGTVAYLCAECAEDEASFQAWGVGEDDAPAVFAVCVRDVPLVFFASKIDAEAHAQRVRGSWVCRELLGVERDRVTVRELAVAPRRRREGGTDGPIR